MAKQRALFLGLPLDADADVQTVCNMLHDKSSPHGVTFVNPYAWAVAKRDPEYLLALGNMSLVLADGHGIACAYRWLLKGKCPRISFDMTSLADAFFKRALAENATLVLVGGKPGVGEAVGAKLVKYYPGIRVVGALDGYSPVETGIERIMMLKPDVVVVGMGVPKQESFLQALRDAGYNGFAITCGGFFDQYLASCGNRYYPEWIDRLNLRFLYRLCKEPRRLWRRYLIDYRVFLARAGASALEGMRKNFSEVRDKIFETLS